jgi:uncharacterized OB-fold protein
MTALRKAGEYRGPAPVVHPESEPFWRGLGEGTLQLQQCGTCQTIRFPVAPVCWNCGSLEYEWTAVRTGGTVSAAVTVRRATGNQLWAQEVPFVTAQVDMDGGRRLPGRVICDPETELKPGTPVEAAYLEAENGYGVLCFVLKESA